MIKIDYKKLLEKRNADQGFATFLKIETTKIEEGYAEAKIDILPEFLNSQMIIHGGLLFTLADNVGGSAARSYGYNVVTVNANIEYLKPGANVETLYGRAKVLSHGHKISRYTIELEDQYKNLLAVGIFTYSSKEKFSEFV